MKGRIVFLGLAALVVEAGLLSLAHWQWNRYQQRQTEQSAFALRPSISLSGKFLNNYTVALDNQPNPANPEEQMGWRILTPLQSAGNIIMVDRGWTPPRFNADGTPDFSAFITEHQRVQGISQSYPRRRGWLGGPDTTTHPRLLAFLNPRQIVSGTELVSATFIPEYLIAIQPTGGAGLAAGAPPLPAPLRHFSYALQWLGMAVAFPILCGMAWFKTRRKKT